MAATKKNIPGKTKTSRFFVVRTVRETRETLENKLKDYNTNVIEKKLDAGRSFLKELKAEPMEKLDTLLDDAQDVVKTVSTSTRKRYTAALKDGKAYLEKTADHPFKTIGDTVKSVKDDARKSIEKMDASKESYLATRKKVIQGLNQDIKLVFDDIAGLGKKRLGLSSFPNMLNLPSRKEIDSLLKGLEGLNKKMENLSAQKAGA